MKNLPIILLAFALILASCSKEEEVVTPPAPNKYTLTITADTGGAVSSPGGTYNEGSKIIVTATPDGMYLFKEWSDGSTQNPREITITSNLTLKASFVKKTYPLAVTVEGEGTVQEEVIIQGSTSETTYNAGTTVRLTATPNEGWVFAGWSGDIESDALVIEVPIAKGTSVNALFKRSSFELNITIVGEGTVTEEVIVQPGQYDYETVVRLTAIPADGYEFSGWSGDIVSSENPITITMLGTSQVAAEFKFVFRLSSLDINHPMKLDIWNGLGITSNSNVMIDISGELHLISHPADPRGSIEKFFPSLHFIKSDSNWEIQNYFEGINMSFGGRDVHPFGNKGFVWADHGAEVWLAGGDGRPFNNVWTATNISRDNTIWTKVNEYRSFYHGVSSGDLNNDGLDDVIAVHMSTNAPQNDYKYHTKYHVFYQNTDGSFEQRFDVLEYPNSPFPSYFSWDDEKIENPLGVIRASVLIEDITGDGMPEIIGGASIHKSEWNVPLNAQNSLEIFSDVDSDGRYEILNIQNRIGFWEYDNIGASQIKAVDYDNDGDKDLIVNFEGSKGSEYLDSANFNGVQVFNNLGNGQFEFSGIEIPFEDIRISEFELIDVDNDNDLDIVFNANLEIDLGTLNGGVSSSFFYQDQNRLITNLGVFDENYYSATLDLDEMIYYNDGGSFNKHNNGFEIRILKAIRRLTSSQEYIGTGLKTLNATKVSGKLKFYGYLNDIDPAKSDNDTSKYIIKLFEYEPSFD